MTLRCFASSLSFLVAALLGTSCDSAGCREDDGCAGATVCVAGACEDVECDDDDDCERLGETVTCESIDPATGLGACQESAE